VSSSVACRVWVREVGSCWRAEEEHKHRQAGRDGRAARVYDRSFVELWGQAAMGW
jgi:hypothetical protein